MTLQTTSSTTATTAASMAAAAGGASGASGTTSAAEQSDRFMTLLVAQMKNQDPLNPMDNAQMTSQIAQINTVSGIEKLNATVQTLVTSFQAFQNQSALQLPGRTVLVEGQAFASAGGPVGAGLSLDSAADSVHADILDASGAVVRSLDLGAGRPGVRNFIWDGMRADGQAAAAGIYKLRVTASTAGHSQSATALVPARVQAVSNSATGPMLDLGSLGVHPYGDVRSFL